MRYLIIIALFFVSCYDDNDNNNNSNEPVDNYKITYKVTGQAKDFSVTIDDSTDNTAQYDVKDGWTYTFTREKYSSDWLYLSAQANSNNAKVTAKILIDGQVWKSTTSKGDYVIANVDGSLSDY